MYNHEPKDYHCPFCKLVKDGHDGDTDRRDEIVYQDQVVTAFMSSQTWPKNSGNVIVVPNTHYENLYDLPEEIGHEIFDVSKKTAIAMKKAYGCDGISTRQHNEAAGNQSVWHFHYHVIPRYDGDDLYINHKNKRETSSEERREYAKKLKKYL